MVGHCQVYAVYLCIQQLLLPDPLALQSAVWPSAGAALVPLSCGVTLRLAAAAAAAAISHLLQVVVHGIDHVLIPPVYYNKSSTVMERGGRQASMGAADATGANNGGAASAGVNTPVGSASTGADAGANGAGAEGGVSTPVGSSSANGNVGRRLHGFGIMRW